jgi:glycosyltransferase involved in cell wall biosynthesis
MPHILNRADKIIVTSWDYAQRSRLRHRLRDMPEKFAEVPIGVQANTFKPRRKDKALEEKYQFVNKKVIMFIGALDKAHYFKGVTYLIKAFQLISSNDDYRLMIIGQGDLSRSYQSLVSSFGLEKKVVFTGFVPDDALPLYYNLGDIMVLPSIDGSEAFGMVLLEAMASGLPVIASDLPGVRSVVDKKENGFLVKPKDVASLAKYLDLLLKNPHLAGEFGSKGRAKVLDKYDWSTIAKSLEDIFNDVIS